MPAAHNPMTLRQAMLNSGWTALDSRTHPRAYVDAGGNRFGTLERDGVRVALSLGQVLADERGTPMVYSSELLSDVIVRALLVDPDQRRQGKATQTMRAICQLADHIGATLYLEATPIGDKPMAAKSLQKFYAVFGFDLPRTCAGVMLRQQA